MERFKYLDIILIFQPFFRKSVRNTDSDAAGFIRKDGSVSKPGDKVRFRYGKLYLT